MRFTAFCAGVAICLGTFAAPSFSQDLTERLSAADPEAGEKKFRQCKACHTVEAGEPNRVGPNLYGIIDSPVASVSGFKYSPALRDHGGNWEVERLDAFLEDPRKTVPRTRMTFRGISDSADRADVIAYLNSESDAPISFGTEGTETESETSEASQEDFGQLFVAEGVEETFYACTACHSEMIVAQQGKTRDGWKKLLVWMVEEQGMSELPEAELDVILDYLAAHYNTDRPNFPKR